MVNKLNNSFLFFSILLIFLIITSFVIFLFNSHESNKNYSGNAIDDGLYSELYKDSYTYTKEYGEDLEIDNQHKNEINKKDYLGYIIEFEEESILENRLRIKEEIKKSNEFKVDNLEDINLELNTKTKNYLDKIEYNNAKIKSDIVSNIRKSRKDLFLKNSEVIKKEYITAFNGVFMDVSDEEAENIKEIPGVKNVYPNYIIHIDLMNSVPLIGASNVWKLDVNGNNCIISGKECLTGKGVVIGIIDTGVDYKHPDLGGCLGANCKVIGGYDFVNERTDPIDDYGHGTHVAAIAAGNGVLKGVAPDAKIISYKVCNNFGSCSYEDILSAINSAADLDKDGIPMENELDYVDIISLSLGGLGGNPDDGLSKAIDNVVNGGIVAVVAAGNNGPSLGTINSPGTARNAITVGAVDKNKNLALFSSRGPVLWKDSQGKENVLIKPDIVAPGVNICAAQWGDSFNYAKCLDDNHISISGTSMATPHVSGAIALLKQKHPTWTPIEIKNSIKATADNLGSGYSLSEQGYGLINLSKLLKLNYPSNASFEFYVLSPENNQILEVYSPIEIRGIFPENYTSLTVKYKNNDLNNSNWSSSFVSIMGYNLTIARIDPRAYSNGGNYTFEIAITKNGQIKKQTINYIFDKSLMQGWPLKLSLNNPAYMHHPILEDLNKDGIDELIFSTYPDGKIYVVKSDLKNLVGWPKQIGVLGDPRNPVGGYPVIGDLNKDGYKEIIVVSGFSGGGSPGGNLKSYVYAFYFNGSLLNGFPVEIELSEPNNPPTIADLNRDGQVEIIVVTGAESLDTINNTVTEHKKIYIINNKGKFLSGWPVETKGNQRPFNDGVSLVDLNNDGKLEIILGTLNYSKLFENSSIQAFYYNGSIVSGFPIYSNNLVSWITIGDVDKDDFQEMVSIYGRYELDGYHSRLSVYNYLKNSFRDVCTTDSQFASIGDLNKDKNIEIVSIFGNQVRIMYSNCTLLSGWPKVSASNYASSSPPVIANIYGDYKEEVLVIGQDGIISAFDFNGNTIPGFPKYIKGIGSDLVVGNFDSDNYSEFIATIQGIDINQPRIYAFNLNSNYIKENISWPKYKHDSQNTGCYDCDKIMTPANSNLACLDSDNGKNYLVAGTLKSKNLIGSDSCTSTKNLIEYYCVNSTFGSKINYYCTYGCENNACKKPTKTLPYLPM